MNNAVADVVRLDEPVCSNLTLDAQIPLVEIWRMVVEVAAEIGSEQTKLQVLSCFKRERIPAGIGCPWIGHIDVRQADIIADRRICPESGVLLDIVSIRKHSVCRANRHPAVATWIPYQADARHKAIDLGAIGGVPNRVLGVAGNNKTAGSTRVDRTGNPLIEQRLVKVRKPAVFAVRGKIGLESDPVVQ